VIQDALLYVASDLDRSAARLTVAHRPLAFRIVMAAVRAGATRVSIPTALRTAALDELIARTPSARHAVAWVDDTTPAPKDDVLFVPAGTLVTASALAPLLSTAAPRANDGSGDAPVATIAARAFTPFWRDAAAGRPVGPALTRALTAEAPGRFPASGIAQRLGDRRSVMDAEARLYATLGSPIDSPLDRVVHRRLSRGITRWAVARGITPNTISMVSIAIGLGGAVAVASDHLLGALVGLLLYIVAVVLDHADGEVARVSFAESRVGEWLDICGDTIVHIALVVAIGITCDRVTGRGLGWGLIGAVGVLASAWAMKTAPPTMDRVAGFFDALGTRDGFYAMLVLFVLGLACWPAALPVLMIVVAGGTHAYWVGSVLTRSRGPAS
jgi:phosphatidylglycerophosphate synthase